MGKPNRPTQEKRNRERAQKERQRRKEDQKAIRKEASANRSSSAVDGIDPDLIGIIPGPQPIQE